MADVNEDKINDFKIGMQYHFDNLFKHYFGDKTLNANVEQPVKINFEEVKPVQKTKKDYDKTDKKNLRAEIRAAAVGCVIVEPKPNELFVDIDREEDLQFFRTNLGWLEDLVTGFDITPSQSGAPGHYHIVVRLSRPVKDAYERIALQCLIGSDRLRELLSWRNVVHQSGRPTVFFEKPSDKLPLQPGEKTPAGQYSEKQSASVPIQSKLLN